MSIFGCGDDPKTPDVNENDKGMKDDEGLSLYEHKEADLRPDLFYPADQYPGKGTSKRLRHDAFFFSYMFPKGQYARRKLQLSPWVLKNPKTGKCVVAHLVDRGPAEWTGRVFDVSPRVAEALGMKTDEILEGIPIL